MEGAASYSLAISVHHICILIAFSLSPKKYLSGKFCLSCLNNSSICHRCLYSKPIYASTFRYVYKDHLGSVVTVTDETGNIIAEQNFDAWGRQRNPDTWDYSGLALNPAWLYRGYTGHEHMPEFSIINMNGRMYDPMLGRMMAADNYIQAPDFTQSFNRFSYCWNNPLKYTDPSGEIVWLPILVGAAIGGMAGWRAGEANNATGWDMVGYIAGGAAIGAVGAGIGSALSAAGAGASVVGTASGAFGGAGFTGLRSNWNLGMMLRGAALGSISGTLGGGVAASRGGGWGAFSGSAVSSGFHSIANEDNIGQIAANMFSGGAFSFGLYHASSFYNWRYRGGNKWGELDVSYRQFNGMQADFVRSRFLGREFGGFLNPNGSYERFAGNGQYPFKIEGAEIRLDAGGNPVPYFHTHWAKPDRTYFVSEKTGLITDSGTRRAWTATRYFSDIDLPTPGPALMLNRFDGAYSPGGTGWIQINPPVSRYFPYVNFAW